MTLTRKRRGYIGVIVLAVILLVTLLIAYAGRDSRVYMNNCAFGRTNCLAALGRYYINKRKMLEDTVYELDDVVESVEHQYGSQMVHSFIMFKAPRLTFPTLDSDTVRRNDDGTVTLQKHTRIECVMYTQMRVDESEPSDSNWQMWGPLTFLFDLHATLDFDYKSAIGFPYSIVANDVKYEIHTLEIIADEDLLNYLEQLDKYFSVRDLITDTVSTQMELDYDENYINNQVRKQNLDRYGDIIRWVLTIYFVLVGLAFLYWMYISSKQTDYIPEQMHWPYKYGEYYGAYYDPYYDLSY